MKNVLIVFFGGGLGSLMRYFVNRWISGFVTVLYPSGTFVANITGCFLIGFFIFYTERLGPNALNWRFVFSYRPLRRLYYILLFFI